MRLNFYKKRQLKEITKEITKRDNEETRRA